LPEWIDPALRERHGWPAWADAVRRAHASESEADLSPTTPAHERLGYDEIFASRLAVALVRARRHR
jgi:ATP-dependent DNA helicase RecG